jgi:hypothetical protein
MNWQKLDKHLKEKCQIKKNLVAINVTEVAAKHKTSRQNIHSQLDRAIKNKGYEKLGEYLLIKLK